MAKLIISALVVFLLLTQFVFAYELSKEAIAAQKSLDEGKQYIIEMINANFSTNKVNDTYTLAKEEYDSKVILEQKLIDVDYSTITTKVADIKSNRDKAFYTYDELTALEMTLEPLKDKNLTETFEIYNEAKEEFNDERYDESLKAIYACYDKISQEQSAQSTLKVFYDNTRKSIRNFLMDNWKTILIVLASIIVITIVGYNRFSRYLLKSKIKHLELEKNVLKNLIKDGQREYFDKGQISETDYHIKIKKFGEMIRDIERQIPLLNEQLAKIAKPERVKKPKKK